MTVLDPTVPHCPSCGGQRIGADIRRHASITVDDAVSGTVL